jgi:hypothetical protein
MAVNRFVSTAATHAVANATAKNKGGRPRTGTAYNKHGVIVVSIRMNRDAPRRRFTFRCPPQPNGDVASLTWAKLVASQLQARYNEGDWDPYVHGVPAEFKENGTIDNGVAVRTVMTIVRAALGTLPAKTRVSILSDALMRELPALVVR